MDKIAKAVRRAEVNGFVAGLIDTGILKVASEEEAAVVADVIEEHLPEEYDMEDAMAIAADVVDALEGGGEEMEDEGMVDEGMVVEASDQKEEVNEAAVMAAYGELAMAKEAGDISEEEFQKEALSLKGMVDGGRRFGSALKGTEIKSGIRRMKGARKALDKGPVRAGVGAAMHQAMETGRLTRNAGLKATGKAYGAVAGVGAAGLGGKKLYDKYNQ